MSPLRTSALVSLCLWLGACGFSLRSNDILTSNFETLALELQQPNSDLARLLQRSLEIASVNLVAAEAATTETTLPLLALGAEQLVSRPISVTPRARAAQYELRLSADVSLRQGADLLLGPETLFVERSYFEDIENISGNREELEIITTEMRRDLVNQLLRRLQALNIQS